MSNAEESEEMTEDEIIYAEEYGEACAFCGIEDGSRDALVPVSKLRKPRHKESKNMSKWTPLYMCFRPDTKSKEKYARCRQYIFYSTADLVKWLRSRKNSTERIRVEYCPTNIVGDEIHIEGSRAELCKREFWPM